MIKVLSHFVYNLTRPMFLFYKYYKIGDLYEQNTDTLLKDNDEWLETPSSTEIVLLRVTEGLLFPKSIIRKFSIFCKKRHFCLFFSILIWQNSSSFLHPQVSLSEIQYSLINYYFLNFCLHGNYILYMYSYFFSIT